MIGDYSRALDRIKNLNGFNLLVQYAPNDVPGIPVHGGSGLSVEHPVQIYWETMSAFDAAIFYMQYCLQNIRTQPRLEDNMCEGIFDLITIFIRLRQLQPFIRRNTENYLPAVVLL